MNSPRIADYEDYLNALSDEALKRELLSTEPGSLSCLKCWKELDKRHLQMDYKVWKSIPDESTDNNEWELREAEQQGENDAQRYENEVNQAFQ